MAWDTVLQCLQKNAQDKKTPIVLAVSGGVDSMVLMHFLFTSGYECVHCCYIDHGLRVDTDQDWAVVTAAAEEYGFAKYSINISEELALRKKSGENLENAARILRYQSLEEVRQEQKATWVLTAHHKDDLLESQLMHFGRGASIYGLIGIQEVDNKYARLRILLSCTKDQIRAYAEEHQLTWHEDSTNTEGAYVRNQLRSDVIPSYKRLYPSLTSSAQQMSQHAQEIMEFHTALVEESLGDLEKVVEIQLSQYKRMPAVLQKHALVLLARSTSSSYTAKHIETLREALYNNLSSGKVLHLSESCRLERSFDRIFILRDQGEAPREVGGIQTFEQAADPSSQYVTELPLDMTEANLVRVLLTNTSRIRQYRLDKSNANADTAWTIWHTTFKKWRMKHAISWQEARSMYGLQDVLTGEIVAVFHEMWHYPESIPTQQREF